MEFFNSDVSDVIGQVLYLLCLSKILVTDFISFRTPQKNVQLYTFFKTIPQQSSRISQKRITVIGPDMSEILYLTFT